MLRRGLKDTAEARSRRQYLKAMFDTVDFSKVKLAPPDPEDEDEEEEQDEQEPVEDKTDELALSPELENAIAALIAANPTLSKQQAAHWLVHTPHGRATLAHLSKRKETPPMTTVAEVIKVHGGVVRIAKLINSENNAHGLTEQDFADMVMAEAKAKRLPGESDAQAFNRFYNDPGNIEMRKAHMITKGWSYK
jgi:hypothetical protein